VLRFADGEADRGFARLDVAQKLAEAHEWRTADVGPARRGRRDAFGGGHEHRQSGANIRRARVVLP
jgi:hypothetical protein